jgi:hypothetical protein
VNAFHGSFFIDALAASRGSSCGMCEGARSVSMAGNQQLASGKIQRSA